MPAGVRAGGDAFEYVGSFTNAADGRERTLAVSRDTDTLVIAAVPHVEWTQVRYDDCDAVVLAQQVFAPSIEWTASGERILANTEPGWVIDVYRDTALVRSLRRAVEPVPAIAELAALEFRNDATAGPCEMTTERLVSKVGFGDLVPAVRDILAAPDGTIWVRRNPRVESLGTFDVLSPEREYAGTATDVPAPIAFMPDGDVVGVERDELDVERVVVYEVVR